MTYIRSTDGAVMIEIAPFIFVSEAAAKRFGLASIRELETAVRAAA